MKKENLTYLVPAVALMLILFFVIEGNISGIALTIALYIPTAIYLNKLKI